MTVQELIKHLKVEVGSGGPLDRCTNRILIADANHDLYELDSVKFVQERGALVIFISET